MPVLDNDPQFYDNPAGTGGSTSVAADAPESSGGWNWGQIGQAIGGVAGGLLGIGGGGQQTSSAPVPQKTPRNYAPAIIGGILLVGVIIVAVVLLKRK